MATIKGWKFPINVDKSTGKVMTIEGNKLVKQSVNIILKTQIFERKIVSRFGSELRSFMFGIVDSNYVSSFKKSISSALKEWEPHIVEINVKTKAAPGAVSRIEAEVEYVTDIEPTVERVTKRINMSGES
ncbi:MAG: GPW/gp25 family protein [Oscillospiraceae bacterium]|nr:GPW/gp25 family protein [Oscillospiraceae bacterium]